MLHHRSALLIAAMLCVASAAAARDSSPPTTHALAPVASVSATVYDTPGLAPLQSTASGIALQITAGGSGAPAGFGLDVMKRSDYEALGGWPSDEFLPSITFSDFDGQPTLHTFSNMSFQLGPSGQAQVFLGELFDETGLWTTNSSELDASTEYVFRIYAEATSGTFASPYSGTLSVTTVSNQSCTYTQGWWKNHFSAWPAPTLMLGSVTYTAAQLLSIFNTPASGNGLISLAHQLIAAKLNIANGAVPTTAISNAIASADALIGALVVPPVGTGYLASSSTSSLTNTLDLFNNGLAGVDHCSSNVITGVRPVTAGRLRTIYR